MMEMAQLLEHESQIVGQSQIQGKKTAKNGSSPFFSVSTKNHIERFFSPA